MNNLKNQILLLLIVISVFSCNFNVGNDYGNSKGNMDLATVESEVKNVIATTLNFFQTGNIEDAKAVFSNANKASCNLAVLTTKSLSSTRFSSSILLYKL